MSLPFFGIFTLVILCWIIHRLYDCKYIIGDSYIRALSGLLSLRKQDKRLEFYNIRGIDIERDLIGRMVNVGDLKIGGAMHDDIEVIFWGIRDPSKYRDIVIEKMRKYRFSERKHSKQEVVPIAEQRLSNNHH